jgi:hypothetical protein
MDLEDLVYSLPSTKTFLDDIARQVRDQVVIVLLPDNLSREMVGRLIRNRLDMTANFSFRELTDPGRRDPVIASSDAMNASWASERTRRTTGNLLLCADLPDMLYVHRIGSADSGWAEFIEEWARERFTLLNSSQAGTPSLCVIAKLRDFVHGLPESGPGLTYYWWWGFPSALEMRLACRIAGLRDGDAIEVVKWREFVLPSLVSSDVQLAERIWSEVLGDQSRIVRGLVKYWEHLDEPASTSDSEINDILGLVKGETRTPYTIGQEVPSELRRIWAGGGLVYTPEYGLEINPSFLAYTNHTVEVQKMVWRGQAELLLPILNEIRLKICTALTDKYGSNWPHKWGLPASTHELEQVKITPLAAELGYLYHLFGSATEKQLPLINEGNLSNLVGLAREMRNQVAHNRPVVYQNYIGLEEALYKAGL